MEIYLNDAKLNLEQNLSIQQLIELQKLNQQGLAIAVNQQILPRSEWSTYQLQANDRLTVFRAIAGG
ncbi:MAG: sulfur carrier protein ThiS [Pasteurella oralis]|uniref:sulfur carrier protein ThiS n=1 Tax=Pasteurella oralis TaxID=1071947 RepID=UPI0026F4B006|nr:sulfur carrier protein ThiS [Pasteurella oralis]